MAMLTMTGRVTMLGLSRWTEKGGGYPGRSNAGSARACPGSLQMSWLFLRHHLLVRTRNTCGRR
ncbi:MAG: hypothetical protein R2838_01670 [Caldilineaceae bacterium]